MPELPDIVVYIESLERRVVGQALTAVRLASVFVLRSVDPPLSALEGRVIQRLSRLGKRIVFEFGEDLFLVLHLMIAGRLRWHVGPDSPIKRFPPRMILASFVFPNGTLVLTEAGTKKRASMYVVKGVEALQQHDPGGIDVMTSDVATFGEVLQRENHTLKRSLTDPHFFSGIGNAYSDEILHRAKLSPLKLTRSLTDSEIARLHAATKDTLANWIERLRAESGSAFPDKVTAFRDGMAVHGRYGKPCPVCGAPVQRIVYASNEANYCARCQTGGKLLADRSLSRLLHEDWPATLDEWEERRPTSQTSSPPARRRRRR
jgi:formamidopyrimidine-DNA glycosylase